MFIAMNRFKIVLGKEQDFESVWKNRDTHLKGVPGFKEFHLVKGNTNEEFTLYASHSICLLYTSPSPRDRTRSRMPSSA